MLFFCTFYSSKSPEKKVSPFPQKFQAAQLFSSLIIIALLANQHIRMISEGSCDTEDWSNDAENTALHHRNKLHFKIYYDIKLIYIIMAILL